MFSTSAAAPVDAFKVTRSSIDPESSGTNKFRLKTNSFNPDASGTRPMRLETMHLERHYDSKGYPQITEAGTPPPEKTGDKWSNFVLTYTRNFDEEDDRYEDSDIEIKSRPLKTILKDVIKDYPGQSFATEKVELSSQAYREGKVGNEEGRTHLKFLLEWYEEQESSLIKQYENLTAQGLITYELLWTIMKPGCTIYAPLDDNPRAFTLTSSTKWKDYHELYITYTDYDGRKFGTVEDNFKIRPFVGSVPITSLVAYPLSWHSRESAIREALIKRGRLFEIYQGKHYMEYSGLAFGPMVMKRKIRLSIHGRVMVDAETFGRINTGRAISVESFDSVEVDSLSARAETPKSLTDDQCLHATSFVCGFTFNEKEWVELFIDKLSPVQWNEHAFEQLVLPVKQKNIVRALVQSHMKDSESDSGFDDVIKGKGKGLISVLHGPPGVGKTLTAESVAEFTKRPLYAVSSGELGTNPTALEENLGRILDVATAFRAVLLLDEGDVFLEQRSLQDINRNALVSIFLRLMEYYQGILFITTNRVGSFDEAFQSRIHIALKYNDLPSESRRAVWKTFLSRLGDDKVDMDDKAYDVLEKHILNGRQIKNAVKTAKSLAEFNGERVALETVETVLNIQKDFEKDLGLGGSGIGFIL
ncbi:P-loop containing nucleoside triphosphate hydrolase protein [Gymnopus androsaceus JB14]|uniref:P-loop containing nucleoside triphosphate hydrolase protein n=1 Tax=Gymnopus androsaceus JB14 TaxID=1447944 RepID=A0A6A4ICG0_9AGAR|nr:P-loop containing nucleoside triphosphate hydrolase protein [Gymnopus androsaceus JB14]